ncbi:MAG: hypothetical protein R2911_08850 [Caldilineaceae bacterium]
MTDESHFEPPPSVLDAAKIIRTVERLSQRIDERFPHSGLHRVSQQLLTIAQQTKERSEAIERSHFVAAHCNWAAGAADPAGHSQHDRAGGHSQRRPALF